MNITPRSLFRGTNSDGTKFTAEEWDFNTLMQIEFTGLIGMIIVGLLLSTIASPIILLICLFNFNGRLNLGNIVGMLVGIYFLFDCSHGWVTLMTLWLFLDESTVNILVAINVACVLTHFILLMLSGTIARIVNGSKGLFIIIVGAVILVGFFIGLGMHTKKGWVEKNVNPSTRYYNSETK